MLVVVANLQDKVAAWLVDRWRPQGAVLLTCADLSASGWRYCFPASQPSQVNAGGKVIASPEITGVLTRMPCVYEQELGHIVAGDRPYVASEMTAFLLAWLSSLTCPVLNRPVPACLAGPNWRSEQWIALAAKLDIPERPVHRSASGNSSSLNPESLCEVIVVGERCFGDAAPQLFDYACLLAQAARVDLLAVYFAGPAPGSALVDASVWPDLAHPQLADAALELLLRRSVC